MNTIQEALQLFRFGLTPIPLDGKRPIIKGWQNRFLDEPLTENDIVNGIKEKDGKVVTYKKQNIGIVTGKVSNVVVIDIDSKEALMRLKEMGDLPKTWTSKSNRGWHLYYNYVPLPSCKPMDDVDFLSDKKQVVAPPSIHPSGHQYRWVISPSEIEKADLPKWFIQFIMNQKQIAQTYKNKKSVSQNASNQLYRKSRELKSIENLLNDVDWLEFYSRFVSNIRGNGEWKSSTCPFHEDTHNSFGFNIYNGGWHCFAGCGSGNGLQAVQKLYDVSFKEAVRLLKGDTLYV